jgi:hypothetical protein
MGTVKPDEAHDGTPGHGGDPVEPGRASVAAQGFDPRRRLLARALLGSMPVILTLRSTGAGAVTSALATRATAHDGTLQDPAFGQLNGSCKDAVKSYSGPTECLPASGGPGLPYATCFTGEVTASGKYQIASPATPRCPQEVEMRNLGSPTTPSCAPAKITCYSNEVVVTYSSGSSLTGSPGSRLSPLG